MSDDSPASMAIRVLGRFAQAQSMMDHVVSASVLEQAGGLGGVMADLFLARITDRERVKLFRAAVDESKIDPVPIDRIVTVFNEAKEVRDTLAHSPSHDFTEADLPLYERTSWRLDWLVAWIEWVNVESAIAHFKRQNGRELERFPFPRPPEELQREQVAAYWARSQAPDEA